MTEYLALFAYFKLYLIKRTHKNKSPEKSPYFQPPKQSILLFK